jgi:hypothetical protein
VYGVHNPSLSNVKRGVVERIFTVDYGNGLQEPIAQTDKGFKSAVAPAWKYLRSHVPRVSKYSREQFLASYDDARLRRRYADAADSTTIHSVNRSDSEVKTFVKAEKVNFSVKIDPAPRIISPRDPRYNYELGLYIKPIEGALYKELNRMCGGTTVMKGLNSLQVGAAIKEAWDEFSDPVAIAFDAARFDQHTRSAALKFEHGVYKTYYSGHEREELAELLSWQLCYKCKSYTAEGVVKFVSKIRASGDMNTGLGTCLIACSLVKSFCEVYCIKFRLINNGDDCVIIVERTQQILVEENLFDYCKTAGYWFVTEKPVYQIEHIEFCQSHPIETERGWTMVRNFPNCLAKDCVSLLPLVSEANWKKWAADVGRCGMALNAGVPVLYQFYAALERSGGGTFGNHPWISRTGASILSKGLKSDPVHISDAARIGFWEAFGWPPDYQRLVEEQYKTVVHDFKLGRAGNYTLNIPNPNAIHFSSNPIYSY